ncbi:MAG TPA: hypothetical protein VK395_22220 [Gemmataceae bacterium]|nr:hypothetical protein [Gemmataceae bacterium]
MANNFQRGDLCPVVFQPIGGSPVTLNITSHNVDFTSTLFEVTHTGLNGAGVARIAGKQDASGTVKADYDSDLSPYAASPNIRNGVSGVILFYVGAPTAPVGVTGQQPPVQGKPLQVPVIIEKVHYESAVHNQVKFSFEVKLNVIAGLAGTSNPPLQIVYPAN